MTPKPEPSREDEWADITAASRASSTQVSDAAVEKAEAETDGGDGALDDAVSAYVEQLDGWWDALRSLAGVSAPDAENAAEEMCRRVDMIMEEECQDNDGNNGEGGEGNEEEEDEEEAVGLKLPPADQLRVDDLSLRANVVLEKSSPPSKADNKAMASASASAASLKLWSRAMSQIPRERFFLYSSSSSYILLGAADALHRCGFLSSSYLVHAQSSLRLAMFIPGVIGTPYAHCLLGRVKLELGDASGAEVELGRALYLVDGEEDELFDDNDDDAKDGGDDKGKGEREQELDGKAKVLARRGMEALLEEEARYSARAEEDEGGQ